MSKVIIESKNKEVDELTKLIQNAKSFLVFEYLGLNVSTITKMRQKLHKEGSSVHVTKNNILNRALQKADIKIESNLNGPNAIIISNGDEIFLFKTISEIMKEKNFVKFKLGYLENKIITNEQLPQIASIPGRNGLYSMLLSCLTYGIRNFLYGLKAVGSTK